MSRVALLVGWALSALVGAGLSPAYAGAATAPVANDDSFVRYTFDYRTVLPVMDNDTDADGGPLSLANVKKTSDPDTQTWAEVDADGRMLVHVGAGDAGSTITWDYWVQDSEGNVSDPATVTLAVRQPEQIRAHRSANRHRAHFANPNDFAVRIKLYWHKVYRNVANEYIRVPAGAGRRTHMYKRDVVYKVFALPGRHAFDGGDL